MGTGKGGRVLVGIGCGVAGSLTGVAGLAACSGLGMRTGGGGAARTCLGRGGAGLAGVAVLTGRVPVPGAAMVVVSNVDRLPETAT